MSKPTALQPNQFYHIYHRGNNRENIFFEEKNYRYFLKLYIKYIEPIAGTYAYCLLPNHVHFCIHTKTSEVLKTSDVSLPATTKTSEVSETSEVYKVLKPSQQFANLFNSYAKAINKAYGRTGSLFENKFGRKTITSEQYYQTLITYIHHNPQTHGIVDDFRDWQWSSYHAILAHQPTRIDKTTVLDWFGGRQAFEDKHIDFQGFENLGSLGELEDY